MVIPDIAEYIVESEADASWLLKSIILWAFQEYSVLSLLHSEQSGRREKRNASGTRWNGREREIKREREEKKVKKQEAAPSRARSLRGWSCLTQYHGLLRASSAILLLCVPNGVKINNLRVATVF